MPFDLITVQEQPEFERVIVAPDETLYQNRDDVPGVSTTGNYTTRNYDGPLADMLALATSSTAAASRPTTPGSLGVRVTATVTRMAGGIAKLTVREEEIRASEPADDTGDDDDQGGGEGTAGEAGKSRTKPTYDYNISTVEQDILLHPMFDEYSRDQLRALKQYKNGGSDGDMFKDSNGQRHHLGDWLRANCSEKDMKRVIRTPQYLDVQVDLTVSYELPRAAPYPTLPDQLTITNPPGPIKPPKGRNYLFLGGGVNSVGRRCKVTEQYRLSGASGWDTEIYKSN